MASVDDWFFLLILPSRVELLQAAASGLHLQVFGDQAGGDRVHGASVGQEHRRRLVTVLVKVEHLSEGRQETRPGLGQTFWREG